MKPDEVVILKDMLYEANQLPREVIEEPELSVFINNWGQPDDLCLVAELEEKYLMVHKFS